MSKLYFYYGTMGSSKTAEALIKNFQYKEAGKTVWLIKPSVDTRETTEGVSADKILIKSRIGINAEAQPINVDDSLFALFYELKTEPDIIICDECQFLTEFQAEELRRIVDIKGIDVFCYGLRTDFKTKCFPGSLRLLEIANEIIEIESICSLCGEQSVVNARYNGEHIIIDGSQIEIGGNDKYKPLCYKCYLKEIYRERGKISEII